MYQTRKIGVVGQGHVGAHVANSLLMQGIADELYLCDINEAKVTSEVQDLRDSLSFVPYNTKIVNCYDHYEELACCDVIVNAAGKVALAAGNRDGELFFTTDAARTFAKRIVDAGFDGIFVSISNPCDVVCTELWHLTGYDPKKIIGSGCGLDSARLRTEISKKVGVSPKSIDAYMIGEHGFSQLAAFKAATIAGKSLNELQAENPDKYAFDHMEVEELACCDVIVNAAGKVALAAGNRDGELFFTTDAARTFAKRIVDAGFDGIFVSISNPCDVVCTELWHLTGYDPKKIIGSGCGLDSARLRTEISKKVGVSPKSIDAYMIGEHGFSQLAAFKAATIAGKSLNELQAENPDKYAFDHMEIEELARKGGYVTYQGKQCTEYAVANSAARVCAAVLHNEHAVLSASTLMTGQYGEEGIFTSLPCVIGAEGVEEVYTLDLSEYELEGFHKSCQHIRDNIAQLDWWDAEGVVGK